MTDELAVAEEEGPTAKLAALSPSSTRTPACVLKWPEKLDLN